MCRFALDWDAQRKLYRASLRATPRLCCKCLPQGASFPQEASVVREVFGQFFPRRLNVVRHRSTLCSRDPDPHSSVGCCGNWHNADAPWPTGARPVERTKEQSAAVGPPSRQQPAEWISNRKFELSEDSYLVGLALPSLSVSGGTTSSNPRCLKIYSIVSRWPCGCPVFLRQIEAPKFHLVLTCLYEAVSYHGDTDQERLNVH